MRQNNINDNDNNNNKMASIVDAATALSTMTGEEEVSSSHNKNSKSNKKDGGSLNDDKDEASSATSDNEEKRFIPAYKKPDAALTFPEKMMSMMKYATKLADDPETFCVSWMPDGKSFIIRTPDEFTRKILPKFFKATKFSSFTRKLYRWGFRQVNRGIGPDDPIIFGNEYFQRDDAELMTKMRSTTAASTRKQEADNLQKMLAQKRALDTWEASERDQKRILLDTLMQQQQNLMQQNVMQQSLNNSNSINNNNNNANNILNNMNNSLMNNNNNGNFLPNNLQNNPLFVQSLQQNMVQQQNQLQLQQQQLQQQSNQMLQQQNQFNGTQGLVNQGSFNIMNAFGNLAAASNAAAGVGKPFDFLGSSSNNNNSNGMLASMNNNGNNPLLNFQLPTSNNGFVNGNLGNINGNNNNNNNVVGNSMVGNQNSAASTVDIVNAAIHALRYAP